MIMRNLFKALFFLVIVFGLCAAEKKSITIRHIGETGAPWLVLVINTRFDGYMLDYSNAKDDIFVYFVVQESTFDEIIILINLSEELFGEKEWIHEAGAFRLYRHGTFELYIEDKEDEHSRCLIENKSSIIFFKKLIELIESEGDNSTLITMLKSLIQYIGA